MRDRLGLSALARFLSQNKAYSFCVIASLGVGISASTSVLALVDTMLHGDLPYGNADRLEVVYSGTGALTDRSYAIEPSVVRALQSEGSPFAELALFRFK